MDDANPIIPVNIEIKEINDKTLVVISVKKGKSPPYFLKQRGIFVRKDSRDFQISRHELDDMYLKKIC